MKKQNWIQISVVAFSLCLATALAFLQPAKAEETAKTVRVGWYESSFNTMDQSRRRSGYAYEYQLKVAAYTGWTYEYVNGSWSELMEMLENGQIDLMSDVSYAEAREEHMFFSSLPMGSEDYCLFIAPGSKSVSPADIGTLNGKKVGVNKGSVQVGFFATWAQKHGIEAELVEVTGTENESLAMLKDGALDAYVTVDSFTDPQKAISVCKIGSSDFFFAVNKQRPDLLQELNQAMASIQEENRYYNSQMYEKFFTRVEANAFLNEKETQWLATHPTIRVGYQDNYLAFCTADEETGELTGALKDYLAFASNGFENARLDFVAVSYPTAAAALEAVQQGEIDCMFPANLNGYDGEKIGIVLTAPLLETEIYAMVRVADQKLFAKKEHVIVAVNEGNPNYDSFLMDSFPSWRKVYFPDTSSCLKAVSDGVADCVLISQYRYNNLSRLCDKYRLTPLATGIDTSYCIAMGKGQTELYSILAKTVGLVPNSTLAAALTHYIAEDSRTTFMDFIKEHLGIVMALVSVVLLTILTLMILNMKAFKKARRLISATETDELTGLFNRGYFFQYANRMYHEHPHVPMDAIVLNIEQFHSINALNGRVFGDKVLRVLGSEIRNIAHSNGGIAGRFEADRFDIYCKSMDDYMGIFEKLQGRMDALSNNASIRLRMGVMPWKEGSEPVQLFDHARTACSMARACHQEHLVVFNEKVAEREIYEQRLLNDLRRALDEYEFEVYYQPKYDIQSDPPRLISAEALVRWQHPELGMIPPVDFIPLLEKNGKISQLDKYVWEQAARQIAMWREEYGVTIKISVNLSRIDIFDPNLSTSLDNILAYHGLEHDALKLEVTESAYTENASHVVRVIEQLRNKGYTVEMDDFGTGYSSLNMLSAMPVDVLKMDRGFVQNIDHDDKDFQLVALILGIAENLGIPVIAEGVETEKQMNLLKKLGCSIAQGYFFSKPLPAPDFEKTFIQDNLSSEA